MCCLLKLHRIISPFSIRHVFSSIAPHVIQSHRTVFKYTAPVLLPIPGGLVRSPISPHLNPPTPRFIVPKKLRRRISFSTAVILARIVSYVFLQTAVASIFTFHTINICPRKIAPHFFFLLAGSWNNSILYYSVEAACVLSEIEGAHEVRRYSI